MKYTQLKYVLAFSMLPSVPLSAAMSMVYNFRIAQILQQPLTTGPNDKHHTLVMLPFEQFAKRRDVEVFQNYAGALASFIYDFKSLYLSVDAAFANILEKVDHVKTFSGTEADDVLFTLGNIFKINKKSSVTLAGLFGVPTHKLLSLKHATFGYSQIGTGVQLDGTYTFHKANTLIYGARYLYFVPRDACSLLGKKHKLTLGNIGDILIAYKNSWGKHGFESGFTERWLFGAHVCPNIEGVAERTNYTRTNFYAIYKYNFTIKGHASRFMFNTSYSFDSKPKDFGYKYIVTFWASWGINF